ncbi:MAG TPA: RNA methyltransferase [Desulfonatronum sp.]|nr:RNA methyltransferase [Desulfonatronum sp.]
MRVQSESISDFWTVGRKPVQELLLARPEQVDLVYIQDNVRSRSLGRFVDMCKRLKVRYRLVSSQDLSRLYGGNHQGVLARVFQPGFFDLDAVMEQSRAAVLPLLLALDQIQDPGNVGVLARSVLALGGGGLILPKNRTAALGPVAAKTSAGALNRLPVAHVVNLSRALEQCAAQGFVVFGATMDSQAENILRITPPFPAVLVLGNEEKGIRPGVLKHCSHRVYIPMPGGMQSLNVAQAGAICLGMFAKARHDSLELFSDSATQNRYAGQ